MSDEKVTQENEVEIDDDPVDEEVEDDNHPRKLASIQRIRFHSLIPDAMTASGYKDNIVLARVMGYTVITQKSEFFTDKDTGLFNRDQEGWCIYFETDTLLDSSNPVFAFMASRKYRVRTMKMAGVLSEGLALPLSLFPSVVSDPLEEGRDLTLALKMKKYLTPVETLERRRNPRRHGRNRRRGKGSSTDPRLGPFLKDLFPKTDEANVKSHCYLFTSFSQSDTKVTITEKMDGCSATYWNGRMFSRNYEHVLVDGNYSNNVENYLDMATRYNLLETTKNFPDLAIQGEVVGINCNGNRLGLKDREFLVFAVYNVKTQEYLTTAEMRKVCEALTLKMVPVLFENMDWKELPEHFATLDRLIAFTDARLYPNGFPSEGIVVKQETKYKSSFKLVSRVYLDKIK
jgi:hypothetical protein